MSGSSYTRQWYAKTALAGKSLPMGGCFNEGYLLWGSAIASPRMVKTALRTPAKLAAGSIHADGPLGIPLECHFRDSRGHCGVHIASSRMMPSVMMTLEIASMRFVWYDCRVPAARGCSLNRQSSLLSDCRREVRLSLLGNLVWYKWTGSMVQTSRVTTDGRGIGQAAGVACQVIAFHSCQRYVSGCRNCSSMARGYRG